MKSRHKAFILTCLIGGIFGWLGTDMLVKFITHQLAGDVETVAFWLSLVAFVVTLLPARD